MDDHPDRRPFLEKLLSFMEEKGTAITQCPTISKNPLDLFRLYLYTKERGGYLEVSKKSSNSSQMAWYVCTQLWVCMELGQQKECF